MSKGPPNHFLAHISDVGQKFLRARCRANGHFGMVLTDPGTVKDVRLLRLRVPDICAVLLCFCAARGKDECCFTVHDSLRLFVCPATRNLQCHYSSDCTFDSSVRASVTVKASNARGKQPTTRRYA